MLSESPLVRHYQAALEKLQSVPARAIIINCSTREVTTLALMSALRYAEMPVLVIDCMSTDGSLGWFQSLQAKHRFDLISAPLRPHGESLDAILQAARDEMLLLIDSDLEIRDASIVADMRAGATGSEVYGAGLLHRDLAPSLVAPDGARGRYADRMWIPLTLLKTAPVVHALNHGATFMHSRDYLEFPWSLFLSRLLFVRHRLPLLKGSGLNLWAAARERLHGENIAFREYDTGARVHAALVREGYTFHDLGELDFSYKVRHYHGVTRATLVDGKDNATDPASIARDVRGRLADIYGVSPDGP
jgi:glycosyltransferase involved in cell wall biosynthesis